MVKLLEEFSAFFRCFSFDNGISLVEFLKPRL